MTHSFVCRLGFSQSAAREFLGAARSLGAHSRTLAGWKMLFLILIVGYDDDDDGGGSGGDDHDDDDDDDVGDNVDDNENTDFVSQHGLWWRRCCVVLPRAA